MKKVIKQWLALTLAIGALVSCSEDRNEPSSTAEGRGETVTLSLSAEVSVDDADLRAINYKLGTNAKGQLVPMPQFEDKQIVEVHTILKSSRSGSVPVAKTLKWRYDAAKKKLVLAPTNSDITKDENNIVIPNFNTDGGTKLYISGLIGGTLSGTKVTFAGTRELQGATSAGDAVGSLEVPYAFPWTELTINTTDPNNTRESNGSYKYAQVPSTANLKFAPQGSLIAYKLGNKQKAGAYTFTPTGFTVSSNAFGDKGTFELNTALPTNSTPTVLPAWTEGAPSALVYRFTDGQAPGTLEHEAVAGKTYYAWVMPHKAQPTAVSTRVMIKGESSRPTTSTYRDYAKIWFTDYAPKGSQLTSGRVHQLSANASYPLYLPIQYVTDYNLAGGEGLTYQVEPGSGDGQLNRFGGVQPAGLTGPLRFADSHDNDQSGLYSFIKVVGQYNQYSNPQSRSLQVDVDATFGADKYYVPEADQLTAVFPYEKAIFWDASSPPVSRELIAFGPGDHLLRQIYSSEYSSPISADNGYQDSYIYSIRFKAAPATAVAEQPLWGWNEDIWERVNTAPFYEPVYDNSLKCAYRYHRVGGLYSSWYARSVTSRVIVDVVYLGEEAVPTTLAQISNNAWWSAKEAEGLVISKIFSVPGYINPSNNESSSKGLGVLLDQGREGRYHTTTTNDSYHFRLHIPDWGVGNHYGDQSQGHGYAVRLFQRLNQ